MGTLKKDVQKFYDEYHQKRLRSPDQYSLQRIWSHFKGHILEVGAGRLYWRDTSNKSSYYVLELSFMAARYAVANGHQALQGDGEYLPMQKNAVDMTVCHDVLEHVVNPEAFLAEMARVSRQKVLVAGPNYFGTQHGPGLDRWLPWRALRFVQGHGRGCYRINSAHLQFDDQWYPDADAITAANSSWVRQQLLFHGFQKVHVETWLPPFTWLNKFVVLRHLGPFMIVVASAKKPTVADT